MMMYGDNALEPELDDLGEEFQAQCAAEAPAFPQMNYEQQQFDGMEHMDQAMDEGLMMHTYDHMDAPGGSVQNYVNSMDDPMMGDHEQMQHPQYAQEEYDQDFDDGIGMDQQNNGFVYNTVPVQQIHQQHQYGQVMYEEPAQQMHPVRQHHITQHHDGLSQQPQQNYFVVNNRQNVVPVQRVQQPQQMYTQHHHRDDNQPVYVQQMTNGRGQQVVYVKRVGAQPPVPQRVLVQTPHGLVQRNTRPTHQVRLIGRPVQQQYMQRPTELQQRLSVIRQHQGPPVLERQAPQLSATPEHISRMVDHGDYVIPSPHRPMLAPNTASTSFGGSNGGEYHIRPPPIRSTYQQHPTMVQQQQIYTRDDDVRDSASSVNRSGLPQPQMLAPAEQSKLPYYPKPPPLPIPKKKRPEPPPPAVSATDAAQATAVQRIGTEEGWKQMNSWLVAADTEEKIPHMRDLLRQCLQAKVSVDLLMSNDTPKFVRKLSKNHEDADIKKLAGQCVTKWKKEVASPEVPVSKKEKKPKVVEPIDDEDADDLPLRPAKVTSSPGTSKDRDRESRKLEKRRTSDGAESSDKKDEKKNKAKARVYTAKSRLTGLEELPSDAKPPDAKKKKDATVDSKRPSSSSASTSTPSTSATKKVPVVKKPAPVVQLSTGFMDALTTSAEPKRKVVPRKRVTVEKKDPAPAATASLLELSHHSNPNPLLDGLFADQTKQLEETYSKRTPSPQSKQVLVEAEEPEMAPASRRKIRFADEVGKELVLIKEFEVEEGERINVNHMSPEDMKHHEMVMERKFKDAQGQPVEEEDEAPVKVPEIKWRLTAYPHALWKPDRGMQSQARLAELERQKTVMRVFHDPSLPVPPISECTDFDPILARSHVPKIIPTVLEESTPKPEPLPVVEEPKALPDNLQSLLDGLKMKGIVGGAPSNASASTSISSLASSLQGISSAGLSAITGNRLQSTIQTMPPPSNNSYQQIPTYQQHMMPPPIRQMPPGMPPSMGHPPPIGHTPPVVHPSDNAPAMPAAPVQRLPQMLPGHMAAGPPTAGYGAARQCQFFNTPRGCHFGNRCKFAHGDQPPGVSFNSERGGYYNGRGGYGRPRGGFRGGHGNQHLGRGQPHYGGDSYGSRQTMVEPVRIDTSDVKTIPQSPDHTIQSPTIQSPVGTSAAFSVFPEARAIPVERALDSPASPT